MLVRAKKAENEGFEGGELGRVREFGLHRIQELTGQSSAVVFRVFLGSRNKNPIAPRATKGKPINLQFVQPNAGLQNAKHDAKHHFLDVKRSEGLVKVRFRLRRGKDGRGEEDDVVTLLLPVVDILFTKSKENVRGDVLKVLELRELLQIVRGWASANGTGNEAQS